jgi:hypothetical protein
LIGDKQVEEELMPEIAAAQTPARVEEKKE